jgi:hypothetical protein
MGLITVCLYDYAVIGCKLHGYLPANAALTTVYNVYAWYPQGANRATDTQYIIQYAGGTATVNVNQQTGGGDWNLWELIHSRPEARAR